MDKETLSNYGWIVICVLVMVVMIALAGPFGNFIADAVKSTTQGLFDTNQNALDAAGITIDDNGFTNTDGSSNPALNPSGTIPEGAYYANLNTGTFYTEMPSTVSDGDTFLYGDYVYGYSSADNGWSVMLATEDLGISSYVPDFVCTDRNQTSYDPILESINGKPVTTTLATFFFCASLESITLPSSITTIGESTFQYCNSLKSVDMPKGLKTICQYAFSSCGPVSINLGKCTNLTTIEEKAFRDGDIESIGDIPKSVTTIGKEAFYNCCYLTGTINIPEGITTIDEGTFGFCESLTSIQIPDSVTSIGNKAFESCHSLTSINIPEGVATIGTGAFKHCCSLASVDLSRCTNLTIIDQEAFRNCNSLESITIPKSITTISRFAFEGCSSLTSINIPEGVTTIGEYAFSYTCTSLSSIIFENTIGWTLNDGTALSADDLTNPSTAATYLKSTYYTKVWNRP